MTKAQLIQHVSEEAGITRKQADAAITALQQAIVKSCIDDEDKVDLPELGLFKCKKTKKRDGFNPIKKEKIKIPAKVSISFRPKRSIIKTLKK